MTKQTVCKLKPCNS